MEASVSKVLLQLAFVVELVVFLFAPVALLVGSVVMLPILAIALPTDMAGSPNPHGPGVPGAARCVHRSSRPPDAGRLVGEPSRALRRPDRLSPPRASESEQPTDS
jgi:hypothetical protein